MVINHYLIPRIKFINQTILKFTGTMALIGCMEINMHGQTDHSREYRESQGKAARFAVQQIDPVLRITQFLKLHEGIIIRPKLHCYQFRQGLFGYRRIEESYGTFQTTAPKKKNFLYLPVSKDIGSYLLLVRTPIPKEAGGGGGKIKYELSDWQLLEIPTKDVSKDKPIVIPPFEELAKRELTNEQKALLKDLVGRYEKIEAEAKKKMATPVPPR